MAERRSRRSFGERCLQAKFQFVAQGLLEIEVANESELGDKRRIVGPLTLARAANCATVSNPATG